ncbi:uncharacterized protein LOC113290936 [Papaver somniferum]|uniref:uncharacterized protein LOC113290936 n=1 Tax=Papaver somniferum TaxID=3469 RepID=UPI000E6FF4AB|nr:uncharacterized protein LOC113290936 [Papaver somniferum]
MTGGSVKAPTVKEVALQQKVDGERLSAVEKDLSDLKTQMISLTDSFNTQFSALWKYLRALIPNIPATNSVQNPNLQSDSEGGNPFGESNSNNEFHLSTSNFHHYPKIDFPRFDGSNPRGWLRKCERYFHINSIDPAKQVELASIHLDGKSVSCFLYYQEEEYYERYESLKAIMKASNKLLYDAYFTMSFISGLKDEIRNPVQMLNPKCDTDAFYLTRIQKASVESQLKPSKPYTRTFQPSTSSFTPSASPYKPNLPALTAPPKPPFSSPKPFVTITPTKPSTNIPPIKKLTPAQMNVRRDQGLCYNCDKFYQPGHFCKTQQLFMLVASEEEQSSMTVDDSEEEASSPTNSGESTMEISLHAFTGIITLYTIRVPGKLHKRKILVLIDTSGTNNFVDKTLAEQLHLHIGPISQMLVTVANGDTIIGEGVCSAFKWSMQDHQFSGDLRVLPLGGCDMVLGVDWLKQLGQQITLHGSTSTPYCSMISGNSFLKFLKRKTPTIIGQFFSISCTPASELPLAIVSVLDNFSDVFSEPTSLPPSRDLDYKIPLKANATPSAQPLYRCPYVQKAVVEQMVQDMLALGIINILDLRFGYHQIRMHLSDVYKTAFKNHHGHFDFKVMPFGLTNSPATFKALMNKIFQPYLRKFVLVFFDDILVYSPSLQDHIIHLSQTLQVLRDHSLFSNMSKCCFAQPQLEYPGHLNTAEGVAADPEKIPAMQNWPQPANLKQLRGFLGLTGYYRRFTKGYGTIIKPLTDMLKKDCFSWSPAALEAFLNLKHVMTTAPVLALSNFSLSFVLETDACSRGVGAVLMQTNKPIAFFSKPLCPKALTLSTYEQELLAIVMAV